MKKDILIHNHGGQKVNFLYTTVANMPPKICNIVKLLSSNRRDFFIRCNGQKGKISYTTDTNMHPVNWCNIVKLLSTDKRDFLIRNNGQKIKIDNLNGKFVAVFYLQYPTHRNETHPMGLLEAYKTLHPKGDFEVVFVALADNDDEEESCKWFNYYFQNMPFLADPFSDFGTSKRVRDHLFPPINGYTTEVPVLDKLGYVACIDGMPIFEQHGANWYAFTYQSDHDLWMREHHSVQFSLKEHLSSPSRDYVLTKNRDKVLIGDLESKVVGLLFYRGQNFCDIRSIYDKLKAKGMDFEIVFINRYAKGGYPNEDSFNKYFEKMPWLALPFGDTVCEKLASTLNLDMLMSLMIPENSLVIVKAGVVCSLFAPEIIQQYGIEAYPFTIERAAEIEIEKVSLFSLLDAEGQEFVIQNDNDKTKIEVSKLKGKSVCMLITSNNVRFETLPHLINWYNKMKRMDDQFELVYVSTCESATEFDDIIKKMSSTWLALPFGARSGCKREICNMLILFSDSVPDDLLVFFKPDGKYVTQASLYDSETWALLSNDDYPYNFGIDTVDLTHSYLVMEYQWYS